MQMQDIWGYRDRTWTDVDLVGYSVEAIDGSIGKIDEASNEVGAQLHRRRHRAVDLRQEGAAARRRDRQRRSRGHETSTSSGRRTRSSTRPSSTRTAFPIRATGS